MGYTMGPKPVKRYCAGLAVLRWTVTFCPAGLLSWEPYQARNGAVLTLACNAWRVAEQRKARGKPAHQAWYPFMGAPALFFGECPCWLILYTKIVFLEDYG